MSDKEKIIIQHNIKSKTIQLRKSNYFFGKYEVEIKSEKGIDEKYSFSGLARAKKYYKRIYKELKAKQ